MARKTPTGRRPRRVGPLGGALRGAAAGAAGTTALDAVTYLDMAVRGRGSSSTPTDTVEKIAGTAHVPIPGDAETRANRVQGLGPLLGLVAGVGVGVGTGLIRATGFRPWPPARAGLIMAAVMLAGNGPMAVLGISDPRRWSRTDWLSDVVPHLAYAVVAEATMQAFD